MNLVGQLTIITLAQGVLPFCSSAALSTLYIKSKFLLSSRKFVKREWLNGWLTSLGIELRRDFDIITNWTRQWHIAWKLFGIWIRLISHLLDFALEIYNCFDHAVHNLKTGTCYRCIFAMSHKNLAPLSSDYLSWYLISKIHFNLVSSCVLLIRINNVYLIYSQTFSKDKPLFVFLFQLSNIHNMFRLPPWSHGIWFLTDNKIASPKD